MLVGAFRKLADLLTVLTVSEIAGFQRFDPAIESAAEILRTPQWTTVKTDNTTWQARAEALEAAGLPPGWAKPFAKLLCGPPPGDFDHTYWARGLPGANLFADAWAAQAHRLEWTAGEVFGLDELKPAARHDLKGVAWLLTDGARVVALDERGADIVTQQGSKQRFYRSPIRARAPNVLHNK